MRLRQGHGAVQWPEMACPAVELERISKTYREGDSDRAVLRDISVTIEPGEIAVLVGRSGSGKSTLLNLIAGIDRPASGRVLVDGTDLTALDEDARTRFRRRRIGFVFQFFNLIPLLTVEENLLLPLDLNGGLDAAGRVLELLDTLARESGKTVIMVTHSREVIGVADRIFAIQRGQLVEQTAPSPGAAG